MKNGFTNGIVRLREKLEAACSEVLARSDDDNGFIRKERERAMASFKRLGFPTQAMEAWRSTDLTATLAQDYRIFTEAPETGQDIGQIFQCDIHHLDTDLVTLLNGWYVDHGQAIRQLSCGTVVGSLAAARLAYPALFEAHYGRQADVAAGGLNAINGAFALDGVFVYVPDGVTAGKTVQIVNIINSDENIMIQPRNLVILGKGSKLQLVHCDHSVRHKRSFINSVSELFIGEEAVLDHYKLQNKDNDSAQVTSAFFEQQSGSRLSSTVITLNGGIIRNNLHVKLSGPGCDASLHGLYLVDREQHVDNKIVVDHMAPDCVSRQLYKGIIDDQAMAVFNGYVHVARDAQRTNAYQNNRNILLTDKATVHTQPHLEIYADDVKCSHGATVGQLDPEAMFYMRARGIREDTSRMLMMYAFAADVINHIRIHPVRHQIDEMVYRRLRGELSVCDQCILDCNAQRPQVFEIDLNKI
ncbi:MAG TPA: Fe-S cluster assembly protein SufD [Bacteroidales bacterium]|nr:Fe-S cluster assembly protein SufD [Bacteroidales bacterium]HSA42990.1 Fe-S cluster assembly protein SufD [Bacteroidales bacterium]